LLGFTIGRWKWQSSERFGVGLLAVYIALVFLFITAFVSLLGNQLLAEQLGIVCYFMFALGFILLIVQNITRSIKKDHSANHSVEE
jgi:hypothetical protein